MRKCQECNAPMKIIAAGQTLVGFSSPPGHNHDANCMTITFACAADHRESMRLQRGCLVEGCGWRGDDYCVTCHEANIWDEDALRELAAKQIEWDARRKVRFAEDVAAGRVPSGLTGRESNDS